MTMKLTEGRVTIRILRKREREEIEINTPNASVALLHPGEYHIEVSEDGETTIVKARSGRPKWRARISPTPSAPNEVGVFRGTDELSTDVIEARPANRVRELGERAVESQRAFGFVALRGRGRDRLRGP